jgi:hypothetical protein
MSKHSRWLERPSSRARTTREDTAANTQPGKVYILKSIKRSQSAHPNRSDLAIRRGCFLRLPDCEKEERQEVEDIRESGVDAVFVQLLLVSYIV